MDQACICGSNVTLISRGRGPHAAELRCRNCDRHRQWLSHEDYRICGTVLAEITDRCGEPAEINYRTIKQERIKAMATEQQYDNSGILFRNRAKSGERERDYKGEATIGGISYWISGWLKEKNGNKFLTFSFKPKDQEFGSRTKPKQSPKNELNDKIGF